MVSNVDEKARRLLDAVGSEGMLAVSTSDHGDQLGGYTRLPSSPQRDILDRATRVSKGKETG